MHTSSYDRLDSKSCCIVPEGSRPATHCDQMMYCWAGLTSLHPLRANVTLPAESGGTGQLQGQTQALTDPSASPSGSISITELVLVAVPGTQTLSVALPDFPQVPAIASHTSGL